MEVKEPTENAAPKHNSTEDRQLQSPDYENNAGRDAVRLVTQCVAMPPFQSACFLMIYFIYFLIWSNLMSMLIIMSNLVRTVDADPSS